MRAARCRFLSGSWESWRRSVCFALRRMPLWLSGCRRTCWALDVMWVGRDLLNVHVRNCPMHVSSKVQWPIGGGFCSPLFLDLDFSYTFKVTTISSRSSHPSQSRSPPSFDEDAHRTCCEPFIYTSLPPLIASSRAPRSVSCQTVLLAMSE